MKSSGAWIQSSEMILEFKKGNLNQGDHDVYEPKK
jgi:hypothetical protein